VKIEEHTQPIRKICYGALLEGFACLLVFKDDE